MDSDDEEFKNAKNKGTKRRVNGEARQTDRQRERRRGDDERESQTGEKCTSD